MQSVDDFWTNRQYRYEMEADMECPECSDVRDQRGEIVDQVAKSTKTLIEQLYAKEGPVNYYAIQSAIDQLLNLVESYSDHEIDLPEHVPLISRMSVESQEIWVTPIPSDRVRNLL